MLDGRVRRRLRASGAHRRLKPGTARGPITVLGVDPDTGQPTYQSGQLPPKVLAFTMTPPVR